MQNVHPGVVRLDGDLATGRVHVQEFGRLRDGTSHLNYALYHDSYERTSDGWRFSERVYEVRYADSTPLTGSPAHRPRHLPPPAPHASALQIDPTQHQAKE